MKTTWTILQDDREKTPLLFPKHIVMLDPNSVPWNPRTITVSLQIKKARLTTGDYALEGHESKVLIERKKNLSELHQNLLTLSGRRRFVDCCLRLKSACTRPILILEGTVASLIKAPRHHMACDPWIVIDALQRICLEHGIWIQYLSSTTLDQRRAVGEEVARILINGAVTNGPYPSEHNHEELPSS